MKKIAQFTSIFLIATVANVSSAKDLVTRSGKTFHDCKVLKVSPDGVTFRHASGIAKVPFSDMNDESQSAFGYDADKEAAYKKKAAEDKAKKAEVARARAVEAAKQQAAARQQALENQTLLALQYSAAIQAQASAAQQGYGGYFYGTAGAYPGYGYGYAVDGREYARQGRVNHRSYGAPVQPYSTSLFNHYGALVGFPNTAACNQLSQGYRFTGPYGYRYMQPAVRTVSPVRCSPAPVVGRFSGRIGH